MSDIISSTTPPDQDTRAKKNIEMVHIEGNTDDFSLPIEDRFVELFPDKAKKKLLRKMDLHIIPCLIALYC